MKQQVQIQDQNKVSKMFKQWTKTGVVVNVGDHDDYQVSVDGSRTITKRNRQFLKPFTPAPDVWATQNQPPPSIPSKPPQPPFFPQQYPSVPEQPQQVPVQTPVPEPPQQSPPQQEDTTPAVSPSPPNPSFPLKFRRVQQYPEERWELVQDQPAVLPPPQPQLSPVNYSHPVQYQYPSNQYDSYQYPVHHIPQSQNNGIRQQEPWPTFLNNFPSPNQTVNSTYPVHGQPNLPNMMTMMSSNPQTYSSYSTYQS